MKKNILILSLVFGISNIGAQSTESGSQKSLDDVIVKEKFEAGSEEEKLPIFLNADFSNLVEIKERIYWSSVPWKFGGEEPTVKNYTAKTSTPELAVIAPEPVKVFFVRFEELSRWIMEIFTSDGQLFRTINGEGNPPKSIAWDGRGDGGIPLIPGDSYAYSFTAIDRAGNRRVFPSGAFTIPALYLRDEQETWIGLSYGSIFSPNGYGLAPGAENFATELVNLIYYFSDEGSVSIDSDHPQSDNFIAMVAKKLGRESEFFQRVPASESKGKCFVMRIN